MCIKFIFIYINYKISQDTFGKTKGHSRKSKGHLRKPKGHEGGRPGDLDLGIYIPPLVLKMGIFALLTSLVIILSEMNRGEADSLPIYDIVTFHCQWFYVVLNYPIVWLSGLV